MPGLRFLSKKSITKECRRKRPPTISLPPGPRNKKIDSTHSEKEKFSNLGSVSAAPSKNPWPKGITLAKGTRDYIYHPDKWAPPTRVQGMKASTGLCLEA